MKDRSATQTIPEPSARVEFKVRFTQRPGKGRRPTRIRPADAAGTGGQPDGLAAPEHGAVHSAESHTDPEQVPRITRLLVLGHHFERLVGSGAVKDYAEIARLTELSRARITQVTNLTLVVPIIQEEILFLTRSSACREPNFESKLRQMVPTGVWTDQLASYQRPLSRSIAAVLGGDRPLTRESAPKS